MEHLTPGPQRPGPSALALRAIQVLEDGPQGGRLNAADDDQPGFRFEYRSQNVSAAHRFVVAVICFDPKFLQPLQQLPKFIELGVLTRCACANRRSVHAVLSEAVAMLRDDSGSDRPIQGVVGATRGRAQGRLISIGIGEQLPGDADELGRCKSHSTHGNREEPTHEHAWRPGEQAKRLQRQ